MGEERKRIAVVGVHGVADQQPSDTARAIGRLLSNTEMYEPFRENRIHLPVSPLVVAAPQPDDPQDIRFAREVLHSPDPPGPEDTYDTIRLEACRKGENGPEVHVYEAYWADLSRLSQSFVRIFGELYQLFFHLSWLGVYTIEAASRSHNDDPPWRRMQRLVSRASWALSTPIPVLNLLLAGIVTLIVLFWALLLLEGMTQKVTTAVLGGIVAAAAAGFWLSRQEPLKRTLWFASSAIGPLSGSLLAMWFFRQDRQERFGHLNVFCIFAAAGIALILALIIASYDRRRPGAGRFAIWSGSILGALLLINVIRSTNDRNDISLGLLYSGRFVLAALAVSWAIFLISTPAAHIASWFIKKKSKSDTRAIQTARIMLAIPSFGFLVLSVAMWSAVLPQVVKLAPPSFVYVAAPWPLPDPVIRFVFGIGPLAALCPGDVPASWLIRGLAQALPLMLPFALVAFFAAVWSTLRVAATEVRIPKNGAENIRQWLDYGYQYFVFAGSMLYLTMAVIGPVAAAFWLFEHPPWFPELARKIVFGMGLWVGGSAVGLSAFRGSFQKLALNLHTILDVLLDVDNHLRQYPVGSNPRLQITARYFSLLRHLHERGYDAVVIIAHSQGTVITADLLRLLQVEWPAPPRKSIYFFTMGCPLCQLYEWRFPHLYSWTCGSEGAAGPDLTRLYGVRKWVNAYRTGDYIGRGLWGVKPPEGCEEFSIGPGAHTHYWDRTAPQIRDRLDKLVIEAAT